MKNRNKLLYILFVLVIVIAFSGCSPEIKNTPTQVVEELFKDIENGEFDPISAMTGKESDTEFNEEAAKNLPKSTNLIYEISENISYQIDDETIDGQNASVDVSVKGVDLGEVVQSLTLNYLQASILATNGGEFELTEEEEFKLQDDILSELLADAQYIDQTDTLKLKLENNEWVFQDEKQLGEKLNQLLFNLRATDLQS